MEKKMTYVQAIDNAIKVVEDEETRARLEDLKVSITKRASAKTKVDNSIYFEAVRTALADGALTPTELMAKAGIINTQKVAAIVKEMADVEKSNKGKKVLYSLVK